MGSTVTAILSSTLSTIAEWASLPVAASMSEGVRTALLALLGLLVVIFGCLIAFAFVLRRRPGVTMASRERGDEAQVDENRARAPRAGQRDVRAGQRDVRAGQRDLGAGQRDRRAGQRDPKACPVCRREFDSGLRFCPYDATALIPAPQMLDRIGDPSRAPSVCPTCRRAFEGKVRFCPHDGSDLVPASLGLGPGESDSEHDDHEGVKICPACRDRYGFAASFCGKDGVELVVLN